MMLQMWFSCASADPCPPFPIFLMNKFVVLSFFSWLPIINHSIYQSTDMTLSSVLNIVSIFQSIPLSVCNPSNSWNTKPLHKFASYQLNFPEYRSIRDSSPTAKLKECKVSDSQSLVLKLWKCINREVDWLNLSTTHILGQQILCGWSIYLGDSWNR